MHVDAVVLLAEQVEVSDSGVGVQLERDVVRHRDHQLADPDAGVDLGRSCEGGTEGEIELELAHASS